MSWSQAQDEKAGTPTPLLTYSLLLLLLLLLFRLLRS